VGRRSCGRRPSANAELSLCQLKWRKRSVELTVETQEQAALVERIASVNTQCRLKVDAWRGPMKKAITFRLEAELLELARKSAKEDNRTLTNFVETALREAVGRGRNSSKARQAPRSTSNASQEGESRSRHS
jgi:hypothetical protein